jgi:hypothetical protein
MLGTSMNIYFISFYATAYLFKLGAEGATYVHMFTQAHSGEIHVHMLGHTSIVGQSV